MQISEIISPIKAHRGANLRVVWERQLKTKKAAGAVLVRKKTYAVVRGGVEYDNIGVVKEGRADGTLPAENAGLKWGVWAEYPFHITHKGQDYARFYPASGLEFIPRTEYFLNGVQVDKSQVVDLCLASEFSDKDEDPLCFTVKASNVISIG